MKIRTMKRYFVDFWFKPQSTLPVCLFRICIGFLALQTCFLLWPDLFVWYGEHSLVAHHWMEPGYIDLFRILPTGDQGILLVFFLLAAAAFCMMIGFFTRLSSAVVWLCLIALHNANPFIFNGGDGLIRISAFFLMFSPCDRSLSVDRWLATSGNQNGLIDYQPHAPWVQRLLQLQIACVYWQAFWGKTGGPHWIDGTAVYYVAHLTELQRIKLPFIFENIWLVKLLSWGTLLFEASFWALVWFKRFRYPLLLAGISLHSGIDIVINLPVFGWAMISSYILFCDPADVETWLKLLTALFTNKPGKVAGDGMPSGGATDSATIGAG